MRQDLAVVVPRRRPRATRSSRSSARAGGELLADARVFDVYRGAQVGEGRTSLALAPAVPRAATARSPTRTSRRCATRIVAALRDELGGELRGLSVIVAGASGYAGALAARLARTATRASSSSRSPSAQRRRPAPRRPLPAPPRAAELEELDLDRHGDVDAAIVAYPHGAAAPVVAALRDAACKVVDLSADFRLRDVAELRALVRRAPAPRAARRRRLRPARAATASAIARRRPRRQPGLLPDRDAPRARAARRAGLIADVVDRRQERRLGRRARADRRRRTSSRPTRTSRPTASARHRHTPEIDQELAPLGAPRHLRVTFMPHLVPLDQGELVSCYVTLSDPLGRPVDARLFARRLRRRAVRRARRRAARRARRARHELLPDLRPPRRAHRQGRSSSPRSTTSGRAPRRRPCRTSTSCSGCDETAGHRGMSAPPPTFFRSRWVEVPDARARGAGGGLPARLPRRRRRRRDQAVRRAPTSACSSATRATRRAPRASRARACSPRRCVVTQERCAARRACAPSPPTPATPTPPPAAAASTTPRRCRARRRWPPASPHDAGRGRLDRRHRRPARHAGDRERPARAPRGSCAPTATPTSPQAIMTTDAFEKRATLDVELPARHRPPQRAGQGRGHDPAELRDDALLRADRRRAQRPRRPTCCSASRSSAPSTASRSTASSRRTTPRSCMCSGASGVRDRARDRGRAALRRGARRAAAPARARHRRATARARRASAASSCAAATATAVERAARARRELAAGEDRAATAATRTGAGSRRPSAARCPTPRRSRSTSRSRACRSAPRGAAVPLRRGGARRGASRATRSSTTSACPGEGARDRGLLLRPLARAT